MDKSLPYWNALAFYHLLHKDIRFSLFLKKYTFLIHLESSYINWQHVHK